MVMGVYLDELDRVVGHNRLKTLPLRTLQLRRYGGEWDWRRDMQHRVHKRLVGAGWLTSDGEMPDVLATLIIPQVGGIEIDAHAIEWYLRAALRSIPEARRDAHHHRHLRYARTQGHNSYYEYRRHQALEGGHGSLWYMRHDRGWD